MCSSDPTSLHASDFTCNTQSRRITTIIIFRSTTIIQTMTLNSHRPSAHSFVDRPGQSNNQPLPYYLSYDTIKADLTPNDQGGERPIWPLSSYGPGRDAPRQLLEGAIEQSFEEVRLEYYVARASGNEQSYVSA